MVLTWTKYAQELSGERLRQSYSAVVDGGTIYREAVTYVDLATKTTKAYAESTYYVDGGPVELDWQLASRDVDGERVTEVHSADAGSITLHRNTVTYLDVSTTRLVKSVSVQLFPQATTFASKAFTGGTFYETLAGQKSLQGNGTDKYVTMGNVLPRTKAQDTTLTAWVKTTDSGHYSCVIAKLDSAPPYSGYELSLADQGRAFMQVVDTDQNFLQVMSLVGSIADGEWHSLVGVYSANGDAHQMHLYVDGEINYRVESNNPLTADITNSIPLQIGRRGGSDAGNSNPFAGNMTNVAVWGSAFTAEDARRFHNAGKLADLTLHPQAASLLGWWQLGAAPDTASTIVDRTDAGNDGTGQNLVTGDFKNDVP